MNKKPILVIIFIIAIISVTAEKIEDTPIVGYVNDYAGIISSEDEIQINQILKQLHDAGKAEIVIVTINTLEGMPAEMYAIELAHENLGDTEKDNGLLYLVSVNDRKWRVEVGYGLEGIIPDALSARIGDVVAANYFKNGEYSVGIRYASNEFYKIITDEEYQQKVLQPTYKSPNINTIMNLMFIVFIFISVLGSAKKHKDGKRRDDNLFGAAMLGSLLLGGRGGSNGGNFGGGFGGFGGGGFGGGGSGGGW